jgi:hypothetical protein
VAVTDFAAMLISAIVPRCTLARALDFPFGAEYHRFRPT